MRRKIAKRKRKEILKKGAEIIKEGWNHELGNVFVVKLEYLGWEIITHPERDELEAYKSALECMAVCEDEPRI